jgi:hypothetical protein
MIHPNGCRWAHIEALSVSRNSPLCQTSVEAECDPATPRMIDLALGVRIRRVRADHPSPERDGSRMSCMRDHFPAAWVRLETENGCALRDARPTVGVQDEELVHRKVRVDSIWKIRARRDQIETRRDSVHENEVREQGLRFRPPCLLGFAVLCKCRDTLILQEKAVAVGRAAVELGEVVDIEGPQVLNDVCVPFIRQPEHHAHERVPPCGIVSHFRDNLVGPPGFEPGLSAPKDSSWRSQALIRADVKELNRLTADQRRPALVGFVTTVVTTETPKSCWPQMLEPAGHRRGSYHR